MTPKKHIINRTQVYRRLYTLHQIVEIPFVGSLRLGDIFQMNIIGGSLWT
jgi:hypothetical protein